MVSSLANVGRRVDLEGTFHVKHAILLV